ncbi:MAG: MATE family efflux transporter [Treponema sp.]|uniref:MATE family efflux transporter n=1 Tax=Treponema sp. TaxID=166 RepID=UPI0025796A3E|nr:MATE family efflux transporter [Treponema sp.]MBQ5537452.1 MATE family efflux transporter [Treponema sp.]
MEKKSFNPITEGKIWKSLLAFFFPILIGTIFQQLYNTIDAVIIGKFEGKEALAAVGGGTAVYLTVIIGFFVGITSGAGVVISHLYGARNDRATSEAVHTSLALALAGGFAMTAGGFAASGLVLGAMNTPESITGLSMDYLEIYFISMVPMFVYNMASGIMRAAGDSKTPLWILIAAVFTNIALDLLFVVLFGWGVKGVAWATVASQAESMLVSLLFLKRRSDSLSFRIRKLGFSPQLLMKMLRIGFPAGIQSTFYGVSNLIIQSAINSFGTTTIASWAAFSKIDAVFWTIVNAMGIAVTTFAGQNFGAGKFHRVKSCMAESLSMTLAFTLISAAFFIATAKQCYALFTNDASVIAEGVSMLRFLAPTWFTYISIEILSGIIRGAGDSFKPMVISLFGICFLRVAWLFVVVPRVHTVNTVLTSYPLTWCVTRAAFWLYWFSGKWIHRFHGIAQKSALN